MLKPGLQKIRDACAGRLYLHTFLQEGPKHSACAVCKIRTKRWWCRVQRRQRKVAVSGNGGHRVPSDSGAINIETSHSSWSWVVSWWYSIGIWFHRLINPGVLLWWINHHKNRIVIVSHEFIYMSREFEHFFHVDFRCWLYDLVRMFDMKTPQRMWLFWDLIGKCSDLTMSMEEEQVGEIRV